MPRAEAAPNTEQSRQAQLELSCPHTMPSGFSTKLYTFDPRPSFPFLTVAKRYWQPDSPYLDDSTALTLIFAHGTSFHKEQWEPTIDDLQSAVERHTEVSVRIREIWTVDAPNHGDAAELNEETLKLGYAGVCKSAGACAYGISEAFTSSWMGRIWAQPAFTVKWPRHRRRCRFYTT